MNNRLLSASCALLTAMSLSSAACREMTPPTPNDVPSVDATTNDRPDPAVDVQGSDVQTPPPGDGGMDGGGATNLTLRQLQDITDPAHPMPRARVNLVQPDLVALTGRIVTSSATASDCRFAVWVGTATGGDFAGIQVQEVVPRGAARNCFDAMLVRKIPMSIAPGTRVTSVMDASFGEFCAGPSGGNPAACRNFELTNLFLGAMTATINTTTANPVPAPLTVSVAAVGQDAMGGLGMRTLALEGTLVRIPMANVRVTTTPRDGGTPFSNTFLVDPMDANRSIEVQISNFTTTDCVRDFFAARNGMSVGAVTGILNPDFGVWKIRVRGPMDIEGVDCNTDGGTPMDASSGGG